MTSQGNTRKRILILGGGFGGVYAAIQLSKTLGGRKDIEITLISRENYFVEVLKSRPRQRHSSTLRASRAFPAERNVRLNP